MKYFIELGITILLMGIVANNLPRVLKKIHRQQLLILKETSASTWGKVWIPPE